MNAKETILLARKISNIHGTVAEATRHQRKPEAGLDIDYITALYQATGLPLVLYGESGIRVEYIKRGIKAGIAKIRELITDMEISETQHLLFGV